MDDKEPLEEQQMKDGMKYGKKKAMLEELAALEESLPKVEVPEKSTKLLWWGLGIFVLLLLAGIWYWLNKTPEPRPEERVFATLFKPYPIAGITRGVGQDDLSTRAREAYAAGDLVTAAPLLYELYETEQDTIALFYSGVAAIGSGEVEKGIMQLEKFRNEKNVLSEQTAWYIALGHLKLKQINLILHQLPSLNEKDKNTIQNSINQLTQ